MTAALKTIKMQKDQGPAFVQIQVGEEAGLGKESQSVFAGMKGRV